MLRTLLLAAFTLGVPALGAPAPAPQGSPTVQFLRRHSNAAEPGNPFRVFVRLSAAASVDVSVPYSISGSVTDGNDYTVASSQGAAGELVIPAGQLQGYLQFQVFDDLVYEGTERGHIQLGTPTGADLGAWDLHIFKIEDDEVPPAVSVSLVGSASGELTLPEPAHTLFSGTHDLVAKVELAQPVGLDIPLEFGLTGSAAEGGDVTLVDPGGVFLPEGDTSILVPLQLVVHPDDLFEGLEEVRLAVESREHFVDSPWTVADVSIEDAEQLGTPFCQANANSTGAAAQLTAWNVSPYKPGETVLLAAEGLPSGGFGMFLVATKAQPSTPVGGWNLCIGNPIHRVLGPGAGPHAIGPEGSMALDFDWSLHTGPLAVVPGDTLCFQAWFSDPGAGTPNATQALQFVVR